MSSVPEDLRQALHAYVTAPARLRDALANLDAGALNRRPPGSDWSIRDIVLHLVDAEIVRASRIFAIIASDNPAIAAFDEGRYKLRLQYLWRDPELALALFQNLRFAIGELLEHCDAATFERTGTHEEEGTISLAALLERGARHGREHVEQIIEQRKQVGAPLPADPAP